MTDSKVEEERPSVKDYEKREYQSILRKVNEMLERMCVHEWIRDTKICHRCGYGRLKS